MSRGWQNNPVFGKEPFSERTAWVWIIEEAAWKETSKRLGSTVVPVSRGQFIHSLRYLGEAWGGWGKDRVSRFLHMLQKAGMVRVESATASATAERRITVCNYDKYQISTDSGETENETAARQRRDSGETDKKEVKESKEKDICDFGKSDEQTAMDAFNEMAQRLSLPSAQKMTPQRRAAIRRRLSENGGLPGWDLALKKIEASSFCCGKNRDGWRANLDFLIQASSFTKLIEGGYDDRPSGNTPRGSPGGQRSTTKSSVVVGSPEWKRLESEGLV